MATKIQYCSIESNWNCELDDDISKVVVYQQENDDTNTDNQSSSSCALVGEDENNPCTLFFTTQRSNNFNVSAIDILCTARYMEVYTGSGEYIDTCRGMAVQDLPDNIKLYLLQYSFEESCSKFSIKLKSLQTAGKVWFHAIFISVVPVSNISEASVRSFMGPHIDLDKVKSMIDSSEMSQGAQQLMSVMEAHNKNTDRGMGQMANMGGMMQMFAQMAFSPQVGGQNMAAQRTTQDNTPDTTSKGNICDIDSKVQKSTNQDQSLPNPSEDQTVTPKDGNGMHSSKTHVQDIGTDQATERSDDASENRTLNQVLQRRDLEPTVQEALQEEIGKMEERLLRHMTGLVQASEDRILKRLEQLLGCKGQGHIDLD